MSKIPTGSKLKTKLKKNILEQNNHGTFSAWEVFKQAFLPRFRTILHEGEIDKLAS